MCRKQRTYFELINNIIVNVDKELVDLDIKRQRGTAPTQAFSEFLTNKKQGDWAETTLRNAINREYNDLIAVKYGMDMELVAGDPGFSEFYNKYQDDLDSIGKKPDLLVFKKKDYDFRLGDNLCIYRDEDIEELVKKALFGIEVRSSSFLNNEYELYSTAKIENAKQNILELSARLMTKFGNILQEKNADLYEMFFSLHIDNIHSLDFRLPSWRSNSDEIELIEILKTIKLYLSDLKKRDYLSITPKVEDLKVVYNWIKKYNVPHYYVQVFFDSAFGIGYHDIIALLNNPESKNSDYFIESGDAKNQNKTTIKINTRKCEKIMDNIEMPLHNSEIKKVGDRGRIMFYVNFAASNGDIKREEFRRLFDLDV